MFAEFAKRGPMTPAGLTSTSGVGKLPTPAVPPVGFTPFPQVDAGLRPGSTTIPPAVATTPLGINPLERQPLGVGIPPGHFPTAAAANATADGVKPDDEQATLQVKVEAILREWISICYTPLAQRDPQHALACIVKMVKSECLLCNFAFTKIIYKVFYNSQYFCVLILDASKWSAFHG